MVKRRKCACIPSKPSGLRRNDRTVLPQAGRVAIGLPSSEKLAGQAVVPPNLNQPGRDIPPILCSLAAEQARLSRPRPRQALGQSEDLGLVDDRIDTALEPVPMGGAVEENLVCQGGHRRGIGICILPRPRQKPGERLDPGCGQMGQ